jgi:hypothetical protein
MSNPAKKYAPTVMTPELFADLQAAPEDVRYVLPAEWPAGALAALDMNSASGWDVKTSDDGTVYLAPDGTRFLRLARTDIPTLVGLSTRSSPVPLGLEPGAGRPAWLPSDKDARKARKAAEKNGSGEGKVRSLNVTEGELRDVLTKLLGTLGDLGNMPTVKLLRAEGRKVSNERVKAMLDTLRAERKAAGIASVKGKAEPKKVNASTKAKPVAKAVAKKEAKKAEQKARVATRPAPKPSAKKH